MAPKKGKKVINQDELRRLMREKQRQTTDKKKRIESPFAKYNSLGHLSCVLCNVQVKSEILWQTHILGKQHKEMVSDLKGMKQGSIPMPTPQNPSLKRRLPDGDETKEKKANPTSGTPSSSLPSDFFENPVKATCSGSVQSGAGLSLLAGVYDEEEEEDGIGEAKNKEVDTPGSLAHKGEPVPSGLPDDFFDNSIPSAPAVSHSGSILKADEPDKIVEKKDNTAESLPEGFFDDPVRDAKVRNVEAPKDQMDKEWDEFQKEIRQVNTKSEAIVAEDDEEGRFERQIDEIDEQIQCYRRIEILRDKQEVVKGKSLNVTPQEHTSIVGNYKEEEEDEEELLHLLSRDWRAKGALA